MLFKKNKKGQSAVEFAAVVLFILGAFLVFQKYIVRGFVGRWKSVGDSLGQERIYDPNKTTECRYATFFQGSAPVWFDQTCFETPLSGCMEECVFTEKTRGSCEACLVTCKVNLTTGVDCSQ